jgi:hypothetical protein
MEGSSHGLSFLYYHSICLKAQRSMKHLWGELMSQKFRLGTFQISLKHNKWSNLWVLINLFLFAYVPTQIHFVCHDAWDVNFKKSHQLLTPRYQLQSFKSPHFLQIYFSFSSIVSKFKFPTKIIKSQQLTIT